MRRGGERARVFAAEFEALAVAHIEYDEVVGVLLCKLHVPAMWHNVNDGGVFVQMCMFVHVACACHVARAHLATVHVASRLSDGWKAMDEEGRDAHPGMSSAIV